MMFDRARELAGDIVAEHGRFNKDTKSEDHKYFVNYEGRLYHAASPNALADAIAVVIRDNEYEG